MKTVFISYRRSASQHLARLIFLHLRDNGYDVFLDVDTVDSGAFDRIILRQIAARTHFIVVLSPGSLERCVNKGDWLRREIEEAMRLGRNIVPIVEEGFDFDREIQSLPKSWRDQFTRHNMLPYSHYYYDSAMEKLRTRFLKPPEYAIDVQPTPVADHEEVQRRIQNAAADTKPETVGRLEVTTTDQQPSEITGPSGERGLIRGTGMFSNVINAMQKSLRAAQSTDIDVRQETIELNDLYDYHHIRLIKQHYDYSVEAYEKSLTSAVSAVRQAADTHTRKAYAEQRNNLALLLEEVQQRGFPKPLIAFYEVLYQEMVVRALWTQSIPDTPDVALADINMQPSLISPDWQDNMLNAVHGQLNNFDGVIRRWSPPSEFTVLRAKVIYDMMGAHWQEDSLQHNAAPEDLVEELRAVIDQQLGYSSQLKDSYDKVDQLLTQGRYTDAQALIMEGVIRFNQDKWLMQQLRGRLDHLLTPSVLPDDAPVILAFVQELPIIGPEQQKLLGEYSERVALEKRRNSIVQLISEATDHQNLISRLDEAQRLGVLPQLFQTTRNALSTLDEAYTAYQRQRGAELPRSEAKRTKLRRKLHETRGHLQTAKGDLGTVFPDNSPAFSSHWIETIERQLERDQARLETIAGLRQKLPLLGGIAVVVVAGLIVLFLAFTWWQEREGQKDANATATAQLFAELVQQTAAAADSATAQQVALDDHRNSATADALAFQQTALANDSTAVYLARLTETAAYQSPTPTYTLTPTPLAEIALIQATIYQQETLDAAETFVAAYTATAWERQTQEAIQAVETQYALETQVAEQNAVQTRSAVFALTETEVAFEALQCKLMPVSADSSRAVNVYGNEPAIISDNVMEKFPLYGMIVTARLVANGQNWWVVRVVNETRFLLLERDYYVLQDMENLRFEGVNQFYCDENRLPTMTPSFTPTPTATPTPTMTFTPAATPTPGI